MKLNSPIDNFDWSRNVSQLYGVNHDLYHHKFGLPGGHNGIDLYVRGDKNGYGTKIYSAHKGLAKVHKIFSDFPTKTKGTGVYLHELLADGTILETVYWHLADISVKLGDFVQPGQVIGLMGNTGFVKPEPSPEFPYRGTHLHFAVYLIKNGQRITKDPTPYLYKEGDRLPLFFTRTLTLGSTGDQVSWLQTCLKLSGFAEDYEPINYFGFKTLRDVRRLQIKLGLSPVGIVGPKTRGLLNAKYKL